MASGEHPLGRHRIFWRSLDTALDRPSPGGLQPDPELPGDQRDRAQYAADLVSSQPGTDTAAVRIALGEKRRRHVAGGSRKLTKRGPLRVERHLGQSLTIRAPSPHSHRRIWLLRPFTQED